MKIGIIVYSFTGNTLSVAKRLEEKFLEAGHEVVLEQIKLVGGERPKDDNYQIEAYPDVSIYDMCVFAAPVEGFSLNRVMKNYFTQVSSLKGKKVACFVTEFFPYPWMGGNHAINQMKEICESKDGIVSETGIVNWKNKRREKMIANVIENIARLQLM